MINDPSPETLAKKFWSGTGLQETFPRNIEQAIAMILPLAVVKMPSVTTGAVRRWLKNRHAAPSLPHDRRDLMGCLVAYRGHGIVFVCGADDPEEQRLTVAISWLITGSPGCRRYRHSEKGLRRFWMGFGRLLQQSGRMQYCHTCAWERTCIFSQDAAEMRIQMRA